MIKTEEETFQRYAVHNPETLQRKRNDGTIERHDGDSDSSPQTARLTKVSVFIWVNL